MAEVGIYPLFLEVILNVFKYLIHSLNSDNYLLSGAFIEVKIIKK